MLLLPEDGNNKAEQGTRLTYLNIMISSLLCRRDGWTVLLLSALHIQMYLIQHASPLSLSCWLIGIMHGVCEVVSRWAEATKASVVDLGAWERPAQQVLSSLRRGTSSALLMNGTSHLNALSVWSEYCQL